MTNETKLYLTDIPHVFLQESELMNTVARFMGFFGKGRFLTWSLFLFVAGYISFKAHMERIYILNSYRLIEKNNLSSAECRILVYISLILLLSFAPQKAFSLEGENFEIVNTFKIVFQKGNKQEIASFIKFPLTRESPIPSIDTPEDFIIRFEEVFDHTLSNMIKNSDTHKDWHAVGWRGIMLNNGDLWIDYDGKVLAINYQSDAEKALKSNLIESEKKKIHKSLRIFNEPVLDWKTKRFRVRIDDIGDYKYRYAAWPKDKSPLLKPDLILNNGKWIPEGSGGNHYYEFKNGNYIYKVYVFVLGTADTPIGVLEVFNKDKQLLSEDFIEVMNP